MRRSLAVLAVLAALAAGCGEVVVAFDGGRRADLRVDGPVTIVQGADGTQTVSGRVVNLGDVTAQDVEVTLTTFSGGLPWETVPNVPVFNEVDLSDRLRPGEGGTFAVLFPPPRPLIEAVDVEIRARFPALEGVFFFFFSPGLVIIGG